MNASNPNAGNDAVNGGLKARAEYSKESKLVTVRGKLHEDLFNQPRPLSSNNNLHIRFTRNKDKYCLMSNVKNAAYKIVIDEMVLHMRKIYVSDSVKETLASGQIIFMIDQVFQKGI